MNLTPLTIDEMLNHPAKEYNPKIWKDNIALYAKGEYQFYVIPANEIYSYDRFFVTYQIEAGIIFFSAFGYGLGLNNNGFIKVRIENNILTKEQIEVNGQKGTLKNDKAGRRWMATQSKNYGTIFSNCI